MRISQKVKRLLAILLALVFVFGMENFGDSKLNYFSSSSFRNLSGKSNAFAATKKKKVATKKKVSKKKTSDTKKADNKPSIENIIVSDNYKNLNQNNTNPLIWADVPDADCIRVDDYYYMVSTTMHLSPGAPIMRSKDLVNWEIVSYVYDTLANDAPRNLLYGKNMYGKGSWASSIRYNNGTYYVCFASYDLGKTFIFQTKDIVKGPWTKTQLNGVYHDPSLLFEDGHAYMVYGAAVIRIKELNADATAFKDGGVDKVLVDTTAPNTIVQCEGSHFYKINGKYYLFNISWPASGSGRRVEWCYRSDTLLGTYTGKIVLDDNYLGCGNSGVAQGGIVETKDNKWYGILFQDHGAVGRIPMLVPVTWTEDWPIMGVDGKTPQTLPLGKKEVSKIVTNDEFDYKENKLKLQWQWNHNPNNDLWSVTKRPGYLRLTTGNVVSNIINARNTLSQRTEGPACTTETKLDTAGMKPGDYAGIAAFQTAYGMVGVKVGDDGKKYLMYAYNDGKGNPKEVFSLPINQNSVYLKIDFIFNRGNDISKMMDANKAYFYYSLDGKEWVKLNFQLSMQYTLDMFMGYRAALYNYSTKAAGGYADFDYLHFTR